jgi:hypothetical protein
MPHGDPFKPFQVFGQMPEEVIVLPYGKIFGNGNDD